MGCNYLSLPLITASIMICATFMVVYVPLSVTNFDSSYFAFCLYLFCRAIFQLFGGKQQMAERLQDQVIPIRGPPVCCCLVCLPPPKLTRYPKWRHDMERFPHYWPFMREIHRWPVDTLHNGPARRNHVLFVSLNRLLNKQSRCRWFKKPWRSCDATVIFLDLLTKEP